MKNGRVGVCVRLVVVNEQLDNLLGMEIMLQTTITRRRIMANKSRCVTLDQQNIPVERWDFKTLEVTCAGLMIGKCFGRANQNNFIPPNDAQSSIATVAKVY